MDHRPSLFEQPVVTALQQMAIMAKETHDAFLAAGFDQKTAVAMTVGLLKAG